MKDQEGMIPWEQQLTKQITEYTQWKSDETQEIKGLGPRGPSEAFRGERLHPGSPLTHSCFQAPVLTQQQSHFCLGKTTARQGREQKAFNWGSEWVALWTPNASCRLGHAFPFLPSSAYQLMALLPGLLTRHCWSLGFSLCSGCWAIFVPFCFHPEYPADQCLMFSPHSPSH